MLLGVAKVYTSKNSPKVERLWTKLLILFVFNRYRGRLNCLCAGFEEAPIEAKGEGD
jgi:hypothetical protein